MIDIIQAKKTDWPAIRSFIQETYGINAKYKHQERFEWQLCQNPFKSTPSDYLDSWIAVNKGSVVGQISVQPGKVWVNGEGIDAGWIVDVMVHPDFRGQGLGHKIHSCIRDTGKVLVTLTMAEATRRIAERSGCVTLGAVSQFVRIRTLSPISLRTIVRQRTETRPRIRTLGHVLTSSTNALRLTNMFVSAALMMRNAFVEKPQLRSDVRDFTVLQPQDIDNIHLKMKSKIKMMFDRSYQFCHWRFDLAPNLNYRRALRLKEGKVVGIIFWRMPLGCELKVGTIVDILADPEDNETIRALVSHATAEMHSQCEAIVAGASTGVMKSCLRNFGFVEIKRHHPTVVCKSGEVLDQFQRVGNQCHFSKADHDWDQVHAVYDL